MKYFIVADVHGFYEEMIDALNKAGFDKDNPDHIFVSLGDLLDRGEQPRECLQFVMGLDPTRRVLVRGNHEDLIEDALNRKEFLYHDWHNGTVGTIMTLGEEYWNERRACNKVQKMKLYQDYQNSLVNYYETETGIFVHGWIPETAYDWRFATEDEWKAARWKNGMAEYADEKADEKTIYCGHWHTAWGHAKLHKVCSEFDKDAIFTPFIDPPEDPKIIALDACTAYSKFVNCYVLEE